METANIQIRRESQYPVFFLTRTVDAQREPVFYKVLGKGLEIGELSLPASLNWRKLKGVCSLCTTGQMGPVFIAYKLDDYLAVWQFSPTQAASCAKEIGQLKLVTREITPYKEVHRALVHLGESKFEEAAQLLSSLEQPLTAPLGCLYAKILYWQGKKEEATSVLEQTVELGHLASNSLLAFARSPDGTHFYGGTELVIAAASKGQRRAQYLLGADQQSVPLLVKAARQGSIDACYELGSLHVQQGEVATGLEWLEIAHRGGSSDATTLLGACALYGVGMTVDKELAVEYFTLAAASGNDTAKWNLALCCLRGDGTRVDEGKAFRLYEEVLYTRPGKEESLYLELGLRHVIRHGKGFSPFSSVHSEACKEDKADALALHTLGMKYGHASGYYGCAMHIRLFTDCDEDGTQEMNRLFQAAHERGHPNAKHYTPKHRRRAEHLI